MIKNINQKDPCRVCEPEGKRDYISLLLSANTKGHTERDAADEPVPETQDERMRGPKSGYRDVESRNERRPAKHPEITKI